VKIGYAPSFLAMRVSNELSAAMLVLRVAMLELTETASVSNFFAASSAAACAAFAASTAAFEASIAALAESSA